MALLVVGSIAALDRVVAIAPTGSAVTATVVSLSAFAVGSFWNGRHHGRRWQAFWVLLAGSLLVETFSSMTGVLHDASRGIPTAPDWVRTAAALLAVLALAGFLSMRARGLGTDAVIEGALVATVILFVPWAWAVSDGTTVQDALVALVPLAVWMTASWVLVRLLLLSRERVRAFRYLGLAFLCLTAASAAEAATQLRGRPVDHSRTMTLVLIGYCAWGACALHPSLRKAFQPVQPRAPRFGAAAMLLALASVLAGPVVVVSLGSRALLLRNGNAILIACAVAPATLAVYLVRQVRSRARAEHRAQHDALTGLPNQTLFHDRLDVALAQCRRTRSGLAVMFVDLDRFKSINDSLGHAVGNQLLLGVAKRLRDALRETDTVARMGGDEFAILLHDVETLEDAALVAQKIVDQFAQPFRAGGRELYTSTSIGITVYPDHGQDREALLKHADSAMYRAKARGRDTFEF